MPSIKKQQQLRLRVFAGPNGSGKSTVIQFVRNYKVKGNAIDFGFYINADDIATELRAGSFSFHTYNILVNNKEFVKVTMASGLINEKFPEEIFKKSYKFKNHTIVLIDKDADERIAQIVADFLRKKLLHEKKRFSFETVFSHYSKLDIMQQAKEQGYKVYLYFVSTESPEINKLRVQSRKVQGGHDVPPALIESRYYRSLDFFFFCAPACLPFFFFLKKKKGKKKITPFQIKKGKKKRVEKKKESRYLHGSENIILIKLKNHEALPC